MLEDVYSLSPLQEGLYYHWLSDPASTAYVEQTCYRLKGNFNIALLEKSYQQLVARHPVLRTFFTQDFGDRPLQVVKTGETADFSFIAAAKDPAFSAEDFKAADRNRGFDLHTGPQMRLTLLELAHNVYELVWSFHHILMDGWCAGILLKEFFQLYNSLAKGEHPRLEKVYPYASYIKWLNAVNKKSTLQYWKNYLAGYDTVSSLPKVLVNTGNEYEGKVRRLVLPAAIRQSIAAFCTETGITESTFIQTIWGILLGKYNNTTDVVFGAVVSGRPAELEGVETMIGLFINTIPVRITVKEQATVKGLLKEVQQAFIEGLPHHHVQLAEIQSGSGTGRNLFDHVQAFENYPVQDIVEHSVEKMDGQSRFSLLSVDTFDRSNYDFHMNVSATDVFTIKLTYNRKCYDEAQMDRLEQHLELLISSVLANKNGMVSDLTYLSAAEKNYVLAALDNTHAAFPADKTLVNLFEEQAAATPDKIALVAENKTLTYRELNEQCNQLANYLKNKYHIQPDDLIGVNLDRNEWMVIAMLAALKSGGAYVPLDTEFPQERIEYIVADSNCKVVIDQDELSVFNREQNRYSAENPVQVNKPGHLAYVIYTSGTTGNPKGALIEHGNVVRLFMTDAGMWNFNSNDVWTMFHSCSFDFSVWEMYGPLLFGGKLVIVPKATARDPKAYLRLLLREQVTILNQTPSAFYNLIKEELENNEAALQLRYVIFGGEALSPARLKEWKARYPAVKLINMYGITETTVHVTYKEVTAQEIMHNISNIGKPIPTLSCYILDPMQHPVPVGVPGELYVSGKGVARGYLNRDELTCQRFLSDPFKPGERMYRSGDTVKMLPNGELEYIGRIDNQVKVRGYRIELGEVENALHSNEHIQEAVVIVKKDGNGENNLVAYVVSSNKLNVVVLRAALAGRLPFYMIPSRFIQLDQLPLTANGKIDRKRLPDPEAAGIETGTAYIGGRNEAELQVIAVFEEVLKKSPVSVKDDFFTLGGDSIKSIQIVSRLKQKGYSLMIQDVMLHSVVEDLAQQLQLVSRQIGQDVVEGIIPLSPIQAAFFEEDQPDKHHFNQSVLLRSHAHISEAALRAALSKLVLHHDALRMVYRQTPEGWVQENRGAGQGYLLEVFDNVDDQSFIAHCERLQSTAGLENGPLFRAALFQDATGGRLLLVAHHLVIDGVSWRILFDDLSVLYQQHEAGEPLQLPLKTDSFKYWQEKQLAYAQSGELQKEEIYWTAVEAANVAPLPLDYPAGSNLMKDTSLHTFSLNEQITDRLLTECYKEYQAEINDILLAALSLALAESFKQDSVLIKLEGHGRENIGNNTDITRTVGWFTTTYPVLFNMNSHRDVISQLITVKDTLGSIPNKGIGYGVLRYLGGRPYRLKPEISFNYLGDFGSGVETAQGRRLFEFSSEYHGKGYPGHMIRDTKLDIAGMVVEGKLNLSVRYSNQQYAAATIEKLVSAYKHNLEALVDRLSSNNIITDVSCNQLFFLSDWEIKSPVVVLCYEQEHIDMAAFNAAYKQLVARHETLRTVLPLVNGKRKQQILPFSETAIDIVRCTVLDTVNELDTIIANEHFREFDLAVSLIHPKVYKIREGNYYILFNIHHVITDGYSDGVLKRDFMQLYAQDLEEANVVLKPLDYQYRDFVSWQKEFLGSAKGLKCREYWLNKLAGFNPEANFSSLQKAVKAGNNEFSTRILTVIDGDLFEALDSYTRSHNLTRSSLLMGALVLLLNQLTGEEDITVGAAVSGRNSENFGTLDISGLIGYFVNAVFIRNIITRDKPVAKYLQDVQQGFLNDLNHADYPFSKLVAEMPVKAQSPGFLDTIVFYNYHNYEYLKAAVYEAGEDERYGQAEDTVPVQCNFGLTVTEYGNCLKLELIFNRHLFDHSLRGKVRDHYLSMLRQIVTEPALTVKAIGELKIAEGSYHDNFII